MKHMTQQARAHERGHQGAMIRHQRHFRAPESAGAPVKQPESSQASRKFDTSASATTSRNQPAIRQHSSLPLGAPGGSGTPGWGLLLLAAAGLCLPGAWSAPFTGQGFVVAKRDAGGWLQPLYNIGSPQEPQVLEAEYLGPKDQRLANAIISRVMLDNLTADGSALPAGASGGAGVLEGAAELGELLEEQQQQQSLVEAPRLRRIMGQLQYLDPEEVVASTRPMYAIASPYPVMSNGEAAYLRRAQSRANAILQSRLQDPFAGAHTSGGAFTKRPDASFGPIARLVTGADQLGAHSTGAQVQPVVGQLGKRPSSLSRYDVGLGKRVMPKARFDFGLGKRAPALASAKYNFGLGK